MKIVIVSNRLPYNITKKDDVFHIVQSIGGLATGMNSFLRNVNNESEHINHLWIGSHNQFNESDEKTIKDELNSINCKPIFLDKDLMEKFYVGFCNNSLWPLFHYFNSCYSYDEEAWEIYKQVNEKFCESIVEVLEPGDMVWIHDYHFMLLPQLLHTKMPSIKIGFFLHIPFPAYEMFQLLPAKCRADIVNGLLGSNLIGFHTDEYVQNFAKCVNKTLGYDVHEDSVTTPQKNVKIGAYPMGIDYEYINSTSSSYQDSETRQELLDLTNNSKIILSIDRMDYTKGIINRLQGFENFLENNPQWKRRVVLYLIVAPSRENVASYQMMKKQVDEIVGNINGKFGDIDWVPIHYQYRSYTLDQLIMLFNVSHVALVTPLRDGMNLISKEYVAAKLDQSGVLILSETAGAANELPEAVIINANCIYEIAEGLKTALEMDLNEQSRRMLSMQNRIKRYDVVYWGKHFIKELSNDSDKNKVCSIKQLQHHNLIEIKNHFRQAQQRLFLLDYDGTLVDFNSDPKLATPKQELCELLMHLSSDAKNHVTLISGRDRFTLEEWFGGVNINLISDHGAWIKTKNEWLSTTGIQEANTWKNKIIMIFENYMQNFPGTFIENKEFSITWHYRNTDKMVIEDYLEGIRNKLIAITNNFDLRILMGNKIIEVMPNNIGKHIGVNKVISAKYYDFIMAIGDDLTDEDMFMALPNESYTIKVGNQNSVAKFTLQSPTEVLKLLNEFQVESHETTAAIDIA